jgi:hypothetical protein
MENAKSLRANPAQVPLAEWDLATGGCEQNPRFDCIETPPDVKNVDSPSQRCASL